MTANILFIETQGNVLRKLQKSKAMQEQHIDSLYISDPASETIKDLLARRKIELVVVNFASDLKQCNEFCLKLREYSSSFIMFVLLVDNYSDQLVNQIRYAHQTLALSCPESEVVAAISRGVEVAMEIKTKPKLESLLGKLDVLPSPPSVYFDLREQLRSPSCNAKTLTQLISRDQTMSAKLLRVANSGFFAVPRSITNLQQAITLLGTDTLLSLVLTTHLFNSLPLPGLNLDRLWKHSIDVALMARHIAKDIGAGQEAVEMCGIAGLLHDLGQLVFLSYQPAEYQGLLRKSNGDESLLTGFEVELFGIDHAEIGAIVLKLWGLSDDVIKSVAQHHNETTTVSLDDLSASWAVFIAEYLFNYYGILDSEEREKLNENPPFNCPPNQLEKWMRSYLNALKKETETV